MSAPDLSPVLTRRCHYAKQHVKSTAWKEIRGDLQYRQLSGAIVSHQSWCRHGVSRFAPAGPPTDNRVSYMGRFNQQVMHTM